jgi:formylglycine-generating enzyme required for sulfatase activity
METEQPKKPVEPALSDCDVVSSNVRGERHCLKLKVSFTDCDQFCPQLVPIPAGNFIMGSPAKELGRVDDEDQLQVAIAKPFAVGRFAVTRREFAAFVSATNYKTEVGCRIYHGTGWRQQADRNWQAPGFAQTDNHPVVCVTWHDAKAYVAWLTSVTGKSYRLLSEAEREYVARAGTTTPFWFGKTVTAKQANYNSNTLYGSGVRGNWRKTTVPVNDFAPNSWGLHNVHGNVWDWTEDGWNKGNTGNPGNGEPRTMGDCTQRVIRGGSWFVNPDALRSAFRNSYRPTYRGSNIGFRVARDLN